MARRLEIEVALTGTERAETNLARLEQKAKDLERAFGKGDISMDQYRKGLVVLGDKADKARADLDQLTAAKKRNEVQAGKTASATDALTGMVTRYVSAAVIGAAIKQTIDWAGNLADLSVKTGINTTNLQKLEGAAITAGGSIDQVSSAVGIMADRMASGDKSALAAIKTLGLNFDTLRKQDPGQTFIDLARAIGNTQDPYERLRLAQDLFGRSGKDLLPTIDAIAKGLGDDIPTASAETITALDEIGDAYERLKQTGKVALSELVVAMRDTFTEAQKYGLFGGVHAAAKGAARRVLGSMFDTTAPAVGAPGMFQNGVSAPGMGADAALTLLTTQNAALRETIKAGIEGQRLAEALRRVTNQLAPTPGVNAGLMQPGVAGWQPGIQGLLGGMLMGRPGPSFVWQPGATQGAGGFNWWDILPGIPGGTTPGVGGLAGLPNVMGSVLGARPGGGALRGFGNTLMGGLPSVLMGALQGGGNIGGSLGGLLGGAAGSAIAGITTAAGTTVGAGMGGMLGSILPGIGTVLGALAGPLIGKLFGPSKSAIADRNATGQIQDMKGGLLQQFGSLDNIRAMDQKLGTDVAGGWGHQSREGLRLFSAEVDVFMEKLERLTALEGEQASVEEQLAALRAKEIPTWQEMQTVAEQYGMNIEALGPAFQQLKMTDVAQGIIDDFEMMRKGGADMGTVLYGMRDEISKLVTDSLQFGTTIPGNMKGMIDTLFKSGDLIDANGKALKDISQIKYGDPVKSETEKIADAITSLTDILQTLVDKIAAIPQKAEETSADVRGSVDPMGGSFETAGDQAEDAFDRAAMAADALLPHLRDVKYEVDGISWGHSPGGLKDIPIKFRDAVAAAKTWQRENDAALAAAQAQINSLSDEIATSLGLIRDTGGPFEEMAKAIGLSSQAMDLFIEKQEAAVRLAEEMAAWREEETRGQADYATTLQRVQDETTLAGLTGLARTLKQLEFQRRDELVGAQDFFKYVGQDGVDKLIAAINAKFDALVAGSIDSETSRATTSPRVGGIGALEAASGVRLQTSGAQPIVVNMTVQGSLVGTDMARVARELGDAVMARLGRSVQVSAF